MKENEVQNDKCVSFSLLCPHQLWQLAKRSCWGLSPEHLMKDNVSLTEVIWFRLFRFSNRSQSIKCQASLFAGRSNALVFLGAALFMNPTTRVRSRHLHFPSCSEKEKFPLKSTASKKKFLYADLGSSIWACVWSQILCTLTSPNFFCSCGRGWTSSRSIVKLAEEQIQQEKEKDLTWRLTLL